MVLRKLCFTLAVLLTWMLSPVQAQEGQAPQDIRVVVDISGSMKLNDPDNLRRPAVRLIAGLLPDGTQVGLWTFGRMVNMLVPHGPLGAGQRDALISGSNQINSIAQRTNIGGAIEKAADSWYAPERSLANTHLILLSDGKVDISASQATNDRERDRVLEELVPALAEQGVTIHTIALSAEADLDLLGAIADMTGGVARVADSADELSRIFADTLGQAVPANEVPLEDNRFTVDQGVEEFTALIFSDTPPEQRELTLVTPSGATYGPDTGANGVRWAREAGYDLITVSEPVPGEWQVRGTPGEGSRVTVVSDLWLEVDPMPSRFRLGEEVDLRAFFTEAGERITDPDFLRVITVSLSMTTEDGRRGTRVLSEGEPPADGVYQDTIARLPEPGQYLLELEADSATFSRKFRKTLVLEPAVDGQSNTADGTSVPLAQEEPVSPEVPEQESSPDDTAGPVDLTQLQEPEPEPPVTQPEPVPEPEEQVMPEEESGEASWGDRLLAWWPWAAGAFAALVLAVVALLVWRRRGSGQDESPDEAVSPEPAAAPPETSVAEAEAEPAAVLADAQEQVPDIEPAATDTAAVEEEAVDDTPVASDALPEAEEELELDDAESADAEPDALAEPEPEQLEPEAEPEAPEPASADEDTLPEDDDDEFGLEDFDLSDIDDLPDLESDETDDELRQSPRDDGAKKE